LFGEVLHCETMLMSENEGEGEGGLEGEPQKRASMPQIIHSQGKFTQRYGSNFDCYLLKIFF
jgi:hypothetical protein